jgi:hypothetical protein
MVANVLAVVCNIIVTTYKTAGYHMPEGKLPMIKDEQTLPDFFAKYTSLNN